MKRRTVLRGVGAAATVAVGASASGAAMNDRTDRMAGTHLAVRDEDGSLRKIPKSVLRNGIDSLNVETNRPCATECCSDCPSYCDFCDCRTCDGGGGGC